MGGVTRYIRLSSTNSEPSLTACTRNQSQLCRRDGYLGTAFAFDGQSDQAVIRSNLALRMSPQDPQNAILNVGLAAAHYLAGQFAEAIGCARKAVRQRSGWPPSHRIYCASLAQAGQLDEARAVLDRFKEIRPDISIAWIGQNVPYQPGPMAKFIEGMRIAGLDPRFGLVEF